MVVPSAFTAVTGAAHWEVLRARAIENQCFVLAAAGRRTQRTQDVRRSSILIDPRGVVVDRLASVPVSSQATSIRR
jgi:predicted amidohydrolase